MSDDEPHADESTHLLQHDVTQVVTSSAAETPASSADTPAAGRGDGRERGGILKGSRSSSLLPADTDLTGPSAIRRSLSTHMKRLSIGGVVEISADGATTTSATADGGRPSLLPRRSTIRKTTSYGAIYPPIYQKLSALHRLSFAEVVERITLTWENVDVYAPPRIGKPLIMRGLSASSANSDKLQPKHILRDISGAVEPSTLLAVMGASGSGKTTLLNVLTYRNRGNLIVNGEIRVNGGRIGSGMSSMSAYIQQEDLFIGTLTVREHLWFQSQLKMDKDVPNDIRAERVADVMHEMSLTKCADVLIGIPGKIKGISGGEKKRLAFASEVLTNPPLLFLDEPTSGLDSYMAQNVLLTLKAMAAKGRSIICTIHQPSSEVFELFDRLLLMAEGRVAYLGSAKEATSFFDKCGFPLPPNYNPADHFVRTLAVESGREDQSREKIRAICDAYHKSPQGEDLKTIITEANFHEDGAMYEEESFGDVSPYKASYFMQMYVVLWRCFLNNMREPGIFRTRVVQITIMSFIYGLVYWQQPINQVSVNNINGVLFLLLNQMTFGFVFNVVMTFPPEFPVFLREHHDGMYRSDVYFLCKSMADIPQFILLPTIFTVVVYFCAGLYLTAEAFFICLAVNLLICNISVSFGYVLSCATSNVGMALAIGPLFVVPFAMIGGFFVNPKSIPIYFIWLKYISWFSYGNEILVCNQWQHITNITCPPLTRTISYPVGNQTMTTVVPVDGGDVSERCFTSGQDIIDMLSYKSSNITFDFLMLLLLFIVFRIIAYLFLWLRSRQTYKIAGKKPAAGP